MKTLKTICLDAEVALKAKKEIPNLSKTINEYLRELLGMKDKEEPK